MRMWRDMLPFARLLLNVYQLSPFLPIQKHLPSTSLDKLRVRRRNKYIHQAYLVPCNLSAASRYCKATSHPGYTSSSPNSPKNLSQIRYHIVDVFSFLSPMQVVVFFRN